MKKFITIILTLLCVITIMPINDVKAKELDASTYTKNSSDTMGYKESSDYEFDITFKVNDAYRYVTYSCTGFKCFANRESGSKSSDLDVAYTLSFLENVPVIKAEVTYTNSKAEALTVLPFVLGDTMIDYIDTSENNVSNNVVTMTSGDYTLFAYSYDETYHAIPTTYAQYAQCRDGQIRADAAEQQTNVGDSAIVFYWDFVTIQPGESIKCTVYFGMVVKEEVDTYTEAATLTPVLSSTDANDFALDTEGKGNATYTIKETKDTVAHITGMELSDVKPNSATPINAYENIVVKCGDTTLIYGTDYTIGSGSIKVTFLKSYLDTLKVGTYDYDISVSTNYTTYNFGAQVIIAASTHPTVPTGVSESSLKMMSLGAIALLAIMIAGKKKEN